MGNWDRNNYLAVIKTRDNITDSVYLDYCIRTDMNVSIEEYKQFMQDHPTSTHPVAERAVEFICLYQGGRMKPDKWGYGEPLKLEFNDETKWQLIRLLTLPAGDECIKKRRFYDADLKNEYWCMTWEWEDRKHAKPFKLSDRPGELPEYMFTMTFYFSKSLKDIYPFIEQFVKDFCLYLNTDYGKIIDQSTMETIFDISPTNKNGD